MKDFTEKDLKGGMKAKTKNSKSCLTHFSLLMEAQDVTFSIYPYCLWQQTSYGAI